VYPLLHEGCVRPNPSDAVFQGLPIVAYPQADGVFFEGKLINPDDAQSAIPPGWTASPLMHPHPLYRDLDNQSLYRHHVTTLLQEARSHYIHIVHIDMFVKNETMHPLPDGNEVIVQYAGEIPVVRVNSLID